MNETQNSNITAIYHSADFDGICCREIARKFLLDAELIGWNFGDALIQFPAEGSVYVMDLPPECLGGTIDPSRLIWIDHHKTSIEKWASSDFKGYRIDGVAACRLAWQWFNAGSGPGYASNVPCTTGPYIERKVTEPLAIRLIGEHDIWDHRDPDAQSFQYALRACDPNWDKLLASDGNMEPESMLIGGRTAQEYARRVDASICKSLTWIMKWEGLIFLCVNHARFNSTLFDAKDVPETGHDALLGFRFDGKKWMVSLYHAKHRTDLDLSEIAKRYGGGGHRGACGFTCQTLPFSL